jgi:Late competence development protein ComFB
MPADFSSLRNYFERQVFEAVVEIAHRYPLLTEEQLPDVACVALNHLPTRYIRLALQCGPAAKAAKRLASWASCSGWSGS